MLYKQMIFNEKFTLNWVSQDQETCQFHSYSDSPKFQGFTFVIFHWINSDSQNFNTLSAYPTKWSNTHKQFIGKLLANCLSVFDHFVKLVLKGLKKFLNQLVFMYSIICRYPSWFPALQWAPIKNIQLSHFPGIFLQTLKHFSCHYQQQSSHWYVFPLLLLFFKTIIRKAIF